MIVDGLLKRCKIVTSSKIIEANIAIDGGLIRDICKDATSPPADRILDVGGRITLPGVIDPHVHFRDPGYTHKEDFKTGSLAAAFGGVTTVLDMPNNDPRIASITSLRRKRDCIRGKSYIDYGLFFEANKDNLRTLESVDVIGYKAYLDNPKIIDYEALSRVFERLDNKVICVHAEDPKIIRKNKKEVKTKGPKAHSEIRSIEAENTGIDKVLALDFGFNQVHFCHVTSAENVNKIIGSDKNVSCEVSPHHLFLNTSAYTKLKNFVKNNPPLRSKAVQEGLWNSLSRVDCIGSDHAPHTKSEKNKSMEDSPSGIPGVETLLPLMMNAVNKRKLTWQTLVRLTSERASEIFNLGDKGGIGVGRYADIVIVDNKKQWTIQADNLHSKCNWTPYEGWKVRGKVEKVFLRGELILDGENICGRPSYGEEVWIKA